MAAEVLPVSDTPIAPETPSKTSNSQISIKEDEKIVLPLLSESLVLDSLWDTLSACLLELEHTPDHHAVLVLQPAVEAFFLVHSSSSTSSRERANANADSNVENHEHVADIAPVSPIFSDNEAAAPRQDEGTTPNAAANAEAPPANAPASTSATPQTWDANQPPKQKSLPLDQLKFLKFAGKQYYSTYSIRPSI